VTLTFVDEGGVEHTCQVDFPRGDPRNPLTDAEIEEKFDALAAPVLTPASIKKVKEAVWGLDRIGSITDLMTMLRADR
jgi:2-methylcitrate dehydratase